MVFLRNRCYVLKFIDVGEYSMHVQCNPLVFIDFHLFFPVGPVVAPCAAAVSPPPPPVVLWSVVAVAALCCLMLVLDSQQFRWFSYVTVSFGCYL